ncbi:sialidase family protein [Sulfuriroseicoccus oceanibius]|uniref:exo-alpha-sialidase n=1 Tax=Sulfuriroseicoccus oceanibius TaxID=2707525 RepID=A0A6B3L765_9BACT|nr:sialidase family protein [Sulfuriroseicoccus oceanibius]QQL45152.1 exo-alpha-sialidase [Sulfuriroseicoccus oceanibius]
MSRMNRIQSLIAGAAMLCAIAPATAGVYKTSFEDTKAGAIDTFSDQDGITWVADGNAAVTAKFAKTGKQALHLLGGENRVVTVKLEGSAQKAKGVRFQAERWTGKDPFKCLLEAQVDGEWRKVGQLDHVIIVGKRMLSDITLAIPPGDTVEALRFTTSTPKDAGTLIDNFELLSEKPDKVTDIPEMLPVPTEPLPLVSETTVFTAGENDCHTYRIPAIITAPNGDLIASCDARWKTSADLIHARDIDIVIKRSTDNGKTWGPIEVVADYPDGTGGTDPSFILDRETGEIFVFYSYMGKKGQTKEFRFHVRSSKDNGKTWSEHRDITADIAPQDWSKGAFKFISSGRGSQMEDGTLIHNYVVLGKGAKIFGSRDHGKTWELMDSEIKPADESRVLELTDGRLMVNSRVGGGFRWVHISEDGGKTWDSKREIQLIDPKCNGAIIRYTSKKDGYAKDRLLFCNAGSQNGRKNLTVRISYDEGKTWSAGKVVDPGPSAYSELTILEDGSIGVLWEPGYNSIKFARFTLEALTDGKDKLTKPYEIK